MIEDNVDMVICSLMSSQFMITKGGQSNVINLDHRHQQEG
jgi:hypothetical protein